MKTDLNRLTRLRLAAAGACLGLAAAAASADVLAVSNFDGELDDRRAGWAGPMKSNEGIAVDVDANALIGAGWARRGLLTTIDFRQPGEYWFRYDVTRDGIGGRSDYSIVSLFNGDKDVQNRPLRFGINSPDNFYFGFVEPKEFGGGTKAGQKYTLIARLVTSADEPDKLEGWAYEGGQVPGELPEPMVTDEYDYSGTASMVNFQTGNQETLQVTFQDFRMATSAKSVMSDDAPEPQAFIHTYRPLRHLKVADSGTHALPIQWANVSLLPRPDGDAPDILIQSGHPWLASNTFLYQPATDEVKASATPAPKESLPLYGQPSFEHNLPMNSYFAVANGDGHELIAVKNLEHIANIDADGNLRVHDKPRSAIAGDAKEVLRELGLKGGTYKTIADADGDGVADVLMAQMVDGSEKWSYWPRGEAPWVLHERDQLGQHLDTANTDGMRGYDIGGQWLGNKRTSEYSWMKGSRDADGNLVFGERKPIYLGYDDYIAQWRTWSHRNTITAIDAVGVDGKKGKHLIALAGDERPLAMPILPSDDGELRIGRSSELLAEGESMNDLFLTMIRGVMDINSDGKVDVLAGTGAHGRLAVVSGDTIGEFKALGGIEQVGGVVAADTLTVPATGDWDGDGIDDLVTGDGTGYYVFWKGTEDPTTFGGTTTFTNSAGEPLVFKGTPNLQGPHEAGWSYSQPELFDWDQDGDLELIGNENTSTLRLHDRVDGDIFSVRSEVFTHNGSKLGVGWRSRMTALPGVHKLAGDNRPVLLYVALDSELKLGIPESVGSTEISEIVPLTFNDGEPLVVTSHAGMSGRLQISVPDWDGDGVWDIMYNTPAKTVPVSEQDPTLIALNDRIKSSTVFWLKNIGTNSEPVFDKPRRITWKDGGVIRVETHALNVEPADLNGDGELDLIVGDGPGFVYGLMRDELRWD